MQSTILVVEDNVVILEATARTLTKAGCRVLTAMTGKEAVQAFKEHGVPIDLLLTDVFMDDMSGIALAADLRALQPGLKVVYVTGADPDVVNEILASQENVRVLRKPTLFEDLKKCVQEVLAAGP